MGLKTLHHIFLIFRLSIFVFYFGAPPDKLVGDSFTFILRQFSALFSQSSLYFYKIMYI